MNTPALKANPALARTALSIRLEALSKEVLAKYPDADIGGMLSRNIAVRSAGYLRTAWLTAHGNLEKSAKDELAAAGASAMQTALSANDPRDRAAAANNYLQAVAYYAGQGLLDDGQAKQLKAKFNQQLADGAFEKFALANPDQALAMNEPPEGVSPDKLEHAQRIAMERLTQPYHELEARLEIEQAETEKRLLAAKAAGKPIGPELETARAHRMVSENFYEAMTGHPFRPASDPATLKALQDGIMDGHVDRATILTAMAAGSVAPKDGAVLEARLSEHQHELHDALGMAKNRAWLTVLHAMNDDWTIDPRTRSEARAEFTALAATAKKPGDFDAIVKTVRDKYQIGAAAAPPPAATPEASAARAAIAAKLKVAGP